METGVADNVAVEADYPIAFHHERFSDHKNICSEKIFIIIFYKTNLRQKATVQHKQLDDACKISMCKGYK